MARTIFAPDAADRDALLARYRAMTEEASDIIVLHENGRIVCATGALWRLLRRTPEEFQAGGYLQLVHPDDLPAAEQLRGTPPPGKVWRATYRVRHRDGHYVWFEVATRGVYDETTGGFVREISVGREIGERKAHELRLQAAREQADAANRAKSAFLAPRQHESRTAHAAKRHHRICRTHARRGVRAAGWPLSRLRRFHRAGGRKPACNAGQYSRCGKA
jgi:PAS domain S-box-containing protein